MEILAHKMKHIVLTPRSTLRPRDNGIVLNNYHTDFHGNCPFSNKLQRINRLGEACWKGVACRPKHYSVFSRRQLCCEDRACPKAHHGAKEWLHLEGGDSVLDSRAPDQTDSWWTNSWERTHSEYPGWLRLALFPSLLKLILLGKKVTLGFRNTL